MEESIHSGLSFFVADQSSATPLKMTLFRSCRLEPQTRLLAFNLAGISSITLVDADVADIANADDGVSLNAIASGLTNGASISFLVQDSCHCPCQSGAGRIWLTMLAWVQTATMNSLLARQMLLTAL